MKSTKGQLKRVAGALLALGLAAPIMASAQTLDGDWIFYDYNAGCTIRTVINAGNYSEVVECGPYKTWQAGSYVFQGNIVVRQVNDFQPKLRWVVDGAPLQYGPSRRTLPRGHWARNATPPGGSYEVTFTSANTMVWRDINLHGTITFQRVR